MSKIWFTLIENHNIQRSFDRTPVAPGIYRLTNSSMPHGFNITETGEVFHHLELVNEAAGNVVYVYDLAKNRRVAYLGLVLLSDTEPVRIKFNRTDGTVFEDGWSGSTDDLLQIKRDVADGLRLPLVDRNYGAGEDIDERLRHGGIDPDSIEVFLSPFTQINLP